MGGFLSRRLDPELHGSSSVTTTARLVSLAWGLGLMAIAVYLGFTAAYNGRFMPGVATANRSLAGLTRSEARPLLESDFAAYRLHLDVAGKPRQVAPTELGTSFNLDATLASAYLIGRRSNWLIPGLPSPHLPKAEVAYQLDRSKLAAYSKAISDELGVAPRNAAIIITAGQPAVQPEQSGWGVNDQALDQVLEDSVAAVSTETIPVLPHKVAAPVSATAVAPALATTKQILATPISLTYADKTFSPSPAEVGSWVTYSVNPSGTGLIPGIDSARLKDYVNQIANQINVAPVSQKVTVNNGVSQVDQVGVNGLAIDQDALTAAITKALMGQQPLAYTISTSPVAFKTLTTNHISLDYGQYIEVNLTTQHLWVYQDHQVIYDSPITSGATGAGLGTVTGLFSIYYKTTNTHLVGYQYGYNYDVPVKYWMPFYSGYGLHDAVWRNGNFGGPDYYYGGSHGCVNLPDATAAFIYNWSVVGTPVWIHN